MTCFRMFSSQQSFGILAVHFIYNPYTMNIQFTKVSQNYFSPNFYQRRNQKIPVLVYLFIENDFSPDF